MELWHQAQIILANKSTSPGERNMYIYIKHIIMKASLHFQWQPQTLLMSTFAATLQLLILTLMLLVANFANVK